MSTIHINKVTFILFVGILFVVALALLEAGRIFW